MEIKTKFDIDDDCWMMLCNKPVKHKITGVYVEITKDGTSVTYNIGTTTNTQMIDECMLFLSKEELIKSL